MRSYFIHKTLFIQVYY